MNSRSALMVIAVLVLIAASVFGYTLLVEENSKLISDLSRQETALRLAQSQKFGLLDDLRLVTTQGQELQKEYVSLKEALKVSQRRIATLGNSYYRLTGLNAAMATQIDQAAQENLSLIRGRDSLEAQFADLVKENVVCQARLGSAEELKKAIREINTHKLGTK